ncbi:MAG: lactaldehyde reductase [Selenomonas sp.]|nr:lactaldehyde reductase [Selenomonas ruminantium]MBO6293702.1 lactaldehyde reductase [Selenomonas sp.]
MANRIILNETSYFGPGAIKEIIPEVQGRGCKKVMVVTDKDLIKFKVATKVTELLEGAGIAFDIYDDVKANPTIENVQNGVAFCKEHGADIIVAIGGGSAIDTSKAIAIIMTNPEFADVRSLEGASPTKHKAMPIIAVSTTSGTAAEVTINYVITDVEKHRKFVCADPHDIPVVAIVDSEMCASMPPKLCASTGMDALVHAIEGYITKGAWELTDMMHLKAIEIISRSLRDSVKGDKTGRENMALGQYIAGMGFSNVGLGIDHSMAHPLSAVYDIPHGTACAILLAPVLKFNAPATGERYREVARAMGVEGVDAMSQEEYRQAAIDAVAKLSADVGIPTKLSELGVQEKDIDFLAESALADACTPGNPRDVTKDEIAEIYRSIL